MGACGVVVFVMLHIDISSAKQTHSRHVCVYEMNGQKVCVCVCVCVCVLGLSKLLKNDVRIFALKKHIYSNIFEFLVAH